MTVTPSKVKVKVTEHLNFRQLSKPCMLAAMTAAPLRGFLVNVARSVLTYLRFTDLNHLVVDSDLNHFGAIDFDLIYKSFFHG